ncbi:MAG: response regulator [Candidatus Hydrogenedentes bacterium]|nr:response regulator [Candidatus Hydrogenedentota bacterium]
MQRILVIDDEPVLRITFRHMLEEHGYAVWVAENGRDGVKLCREVLPDLVLTDILMPEQDGFTTIRMLHEEYPQLPIVAMSAVVGPSGRQQTLDMGAVCCITKPVECNSLLRLVDQVLANGAANRGDNLS